MIMSCAACGVKKVGQHCLTWIVIQLVHKYRTAPYSRTKSPSEFCKFAFAWPSLAHYHPFQAPLSPVADPEGDKSGHGPQPVLKETSPLQRRNKREILGNILNCLPLPNVLTRHMM